MTIICTQDRNGSNSRSTEGTREMNKGRRKRGKSLTKRKRANGGKFFSRAAKKGKTKNQV